MAKKLTIEQQIENQIAKLKKEQETLRKLKEKNAMNMGKVAMKYFDNVDDLKRFLETCKHNGILKQFEEVLTKEKQQKTQQTNVVKSDTIKPIDYGV